MPVIINGSTGISGTDGSAGTPAVQGTDTNTGMYFPAADQIAFAEGGVEAMRLDASGNVGIGTATPAAKLHVVGNTTARLDGTFALDVRPGASDFSSITFKSTNGATTYANIGPEAVGSGSLWINGATNIYLATGGTERARVTSTGALQVGTTTNAAYTVDRINFNAANYYVLNQASTGVVLPNGNTSWSAQSDERLKDVIEPIENAASKVASLRPIIGRYKTDEPTKRRAFLIAQDVQAVLPEAVTEDDQGYLLLAYTELVPLLTAALQEALTEIAALKARVAALEATP